MVKYKGQSFYDQDGNMVRERINGAIEILSCPRTDIFFEKLQRGCEIYKNEQDKKREDRKEYKRKWMANKRNKK
jgi:hypothetical protein